MLRVSVWEVALVWSEGLVLCLAYWIASAKSVLTSSGSR